MSEHKPFEECFQTRNYLQEEAEKKEQEQESRLEIPAEMLQVDNGTVSIGTGILAKLINKFGISRVHLHKGTKHDIEKSRMD